jgi:DNA-binding transcriptional ArsR family regulator
VYDLELAVGRLLTQRQSDDNVREYVEYLANLPRNTCLRLEQIYIDPPKPEGLLWYYRAIIRFAPKRREAPERIDKDMTTMKERVRKACAHTRWGRSPWNIVEEPMSEGVPTHQKQNGSAGPAESLSGPKRDSMSAVELTKKLAVKANESIVARASALDSSTPDDFPDDEAISEAAGKLKMASDITRLTILLILKRNDRNVTELCSDLGSESQPAVSHHLALLRHGRLVQPRREGKNNFYGLTEDGRRLAALIERIVVPGKLHDEEAIREAVGKFDMVSDATRLTILLILKRSDRNVTELCSDLGSESQPAVSHHLALLRHGSLVQPRREGKNNFYGLTEDGRRLAALIERIV